MKRAELNRIAEEYFINISRYLDDSFTHFDIQNIANFRREVKKLKVFLHLTGMESEEETSAGITKKMRKIYGYMEVVLNVQQQLERVRQFVMNHSVNVPDNYQKILENEMNNWKLTGKKITANYSFLVDKNMILSFLPDELTPKSILRFVHYILFEIQMLSQSSSDNSLNIIRKLMENIHYNYFLIQPILNGRLLNLLNEDNTGEFLRFSDVYQERRKTLQYLQSYLSRKRYDGEFSSLKMMEAEWTNEMNIARKRLLAKLHSMGILEYNLNELEIPKVSGD